MRSVYVVLLLYLTCHNRSVLIDMGITSNSSISLLSGLYAEHLEVLREHLHGTGSIADSTVACIHNISLNGCNVVLCCGCSNLTSSYDDINITR